MIGAGPALNDHRPDRRRHSRLFALVSEALPGSGPAGEPGRHNRVRVRVGVPDDYLRRMLDFRNGSIRAGPELRIRVCLTVSRRSPLNEAVPQNTEVYASHPANWLNVRSFSSSHTRLNASPFGWLMLCRLAGAQYVKLVP
jgi:hypothetical protein